MAHLRDLASPLVRGAGFVCPCARQCLIDLCEYGVKCKVE